MTTLTESIKNFVKLFNQHTEQQVAITEDTPAPRVELPKETSSVDASNKKYCKSQKQIHQKHTRANTPITENPGETLDNNCNANRRTKLLRVELVE